DRADRDDEPVDVDRGNPPDRAVLDDVGASRPRPHTEAASLTLLTTLVAPLPAASTAAHAGRRDDHGAILRERLGVHPPHRDRVAGRGHQVVELHPDRLRVTSPTTTVAQAGPTGEGRRSSSA